MRIEKTDSPSFKALYEHKLARTAKSFYLNRGMTTQYNKLLRQLDRFETHGSENSFVFHKTFDGENETQHYLCLKNLSINPAQALVLTASSKFTDILKFFMNITDSSMLKWEELLK